MEWYLFDVTNVDLSDCVEEKDGHSWLNTARLNQVIMQVFREVEDDPAQRIIGISGPAGQVI